MSATLNTRLGVLATYQPESETTMQKVNPRTVCAFLVALLLVTSSQGSAAEMLSDILRDVKWDGIIGTWVDAETNGKAVKKTYAWKIEDRAVEITTTYGDLLGGQELVALMAVNAKTGKVVHMGADSNSGTSLGEWKVEDNGDAVLGLIFIGGDGEEGTLSIRQHREDKDTMTLTIELPQPIKFKLVRAKRAR